MFFTDFVLKSAEPLTAACASLTWHTQAIVSALYSKLSLLFNIIKVISLFEQAKHLFYQLLVLWIDYTVYQMGVVI